MPCAYSCRTVDQCYICSIEDRARIGRVRIEGVQIEGVRTGRCSMRGCEREQGVPFAEAVASVAEPVLALASR